MRGRVDSTQGEIVEVLEALGASVLDLSQVGGGCPDLLVAGPAGAWLVEVKAAKGRIRDSQRAFAATWRGPGVVMLRSREAAIDWWVAVCRASARRDGETTAKGRA